MDRMRGFSLIELLVTMAIAAILAALAAQTYSRYALRSHRTDAHHTLMAIAQAQERWYATYNRYADALGKLGYADPALSPNGYYEVVMSVTGDDDQGFVVTAVPVGRQAGDACGSLSIDNAGRKLPNRVDSAVNANGKCW
ncbi:type IV pilin protein [Dyella nitratireducens]|uniref:Type IV pilin n=1 Tax=Dyella nitratireducens TaxID=1849580 RepID=A0ABQ1GN03_9GAMM|nr:type IV pilin protein [Dyella nitratireducens]GGA47028.1 type IV pilin [Dyella nitratireducens]GLQ41528.1 type IV pilin [Dyella nitratireducens]